MDIMKGTFDNLDELENLYNTLIDYLAGNVNYPGWRKGVYPTMETAKAGISDGNLFTLKIDDTIAGSVILNHRPENGYEQADWGIQAGYTDIAIVHTLVVHPEYMRMGIAGRLMAFAREYSTQNNFKAIRLDVSVHNFPAIALYEKCGYKYRGTVDLGLGYLGLTWFRLYEYIICEE